MGSPCPEVQESKELMNNVVVGIFAGNTVLDTLIAVALDGFYISGGIVTCISEKFRMSAPSGSSVVRSKRSSQGFIHGNALTLLPVCAHA